MNKPERKALHLFIRFENRLIEGNLQKSGEMKQAGLHREAKMLECKIVGHKQALSKFLNVISRFKITPDSLDEEFGNMEAITPAMKHARKKKRRQP